MRWIFLLLAAIALAGCVDPMGATTRQEVRSRADIAIAEANRDAAVGVANAEADGKIAVAYAWSSKLPTIIFLAGLTVVVALVVNWQGRIHLERTKQGAPALPMQRRQPLSLPQLKLLAEQDGMSVQVQGKVAYLLNERNQVVGRRMLEG